MDPKEIQLTTTQKIVPLLKAINDEIPWQIVLVIIVAICTAFFGGAILPVPLIAGAGIFGDFILRRIIIGFVLGLIAFAITGLTIMVIEDKLIPLCRRIKDQYEKHALDQKKKVLDNVIDDEVLHK